MQPDYTASIEFLLRWGSPWILTAISLDKKSIDTHTFQHTETTECLKWLEQHGAERNIYFSVNPTISPVNKKPMREDVLSLSWLHVDIDPRVGEDIDTERARALKLLQNPPDGTPLPTVIVFSGGGYQGFWKLAEPMPINGEEAAFEEAKRYNQALEFVFGADNCHNVDRIMRLPGTINRPDARKKKKGRKESLASLTEWHEDRVYSLGSFKQAPQVQSEQKGFGLTNKVQVSGNIARIDDINTVAGISDLCKVTIVQGTDPDNPTRFPSRSEALFYVCCELVRADLDDDTIFAIITDPEFGISSSIIDKGKGASKYAMRQIERAKEDAIDPNLRKLNERYAVVTMGGKQRVIYEDFDEGLSRFKLVKMTFEDFRNKYLHVKIIAGVDAKGNPRYCPLGKWWLEHEGRRQYEKVIFAPGKEVPESYNMWRGFAVEPVPGTGHHSLYQHILENVCSGDEAVYEYVLGWMANTVQRPGCPGQTAVVLRGDQGVGKGFLARAFGRLFGRHFMHVSNAQHLTGNFNAHLRDCVFLFADEAFYAGDRRHASTLKTLVTEDSLMVEPKGVDTEMVANCLHIMMASNEQWVVPAGLNERRFCVLDVGSKHMQDGNYFGKISDALANGGYSNLLHDLLSRDIKKFDVRKLPRTKALQDQKIRSYDSLQSWWYNKLYDGKVFAADAEWSEHVVATSLLSDLIMHVRTTGGFTDRGCATRLGIFLRNVCPGCSRWQSRESVLVDGVLVQRPYFFTLGPLEELRNHWDEKFGGPYDWPVVDLRDGAGVNLTGGEEIPF